VSAEGQGRAEILRYWRTVELFAPVPVERADPRRKRFRIADDEPLPWAPAHPLAREAVESGRVRRHVVQLGVFRLDAVGALVERALGADDEAFDQRPGGESALGAVLVDAEGRLLAASAVLSSCAWAVGRLAGGAAGDVVALEGFADADDELREVLAHQAADDEPLDHARLGEALSAAVAAAGVDGVLAADEIRVRTQDVRADAEDDTGFLNSFYVDDLSVVADAVAAGDVGPALAAYLQADGEAAAGRVDVRTDLAAVAAATAPERFPLARWPAAADRPAALGQQLAIGEALTMEAGLLGVNGPPGTGKTTLVRDLIAAIVVERARRLAELGHPRDAFDGEPFRWRSGDYSRAVHSWRPELTGFEIVIASQNNGAVENVTHDIPGAEAVDPGWRAAAEAADGFAELAGTLIDREAWGLIAARLGRLTHRTAFASRALWSGKDGRGPEGVMRWLKRLEGEALPDAGDWDAAVATFRRALDEAAALRARREQAAVALRRWPELEARRRAVAEVVDAQTTRAGAAEVALDAATRAAQSAEREEARHAARREEHRRSRPGWGERLTNRRALREWRAHDDALAAPLLDAQRAADVARERLARAEADRDAAARSAAAAWDEAAELDRERATLEDVLGRAREALGDAFPGTDWQDVDARERRERTAPWTDPVLDRARTETFLAALALHRAFLRHVPREMRQSLHGADDVLRGAAPASLPEDAARAAWQALFFVVPVISTTFSSLPRMFRHLGREALGWLVIDEGGQASPPAAAGGVWRARRCVVLGDPRQLTPIDTLSLAVQRTLAREHGVDPEWAPRGLSVQRLADRATPLGTWLTGDDGDDWIGTPLTVHRRCDRPIFDLVNAIAYDGSMVFATDPAAGAAFDRDHPGLPPSKWIDVPATGARGHWVPAQGEQVEHVLAELGRRGIALDDILVVSPFREVADELRALARRRHRGLIAGTVHTVQGREADVVLLVLGGHPEKPGARHWAGRTPNLLNVAISRARRRLYVIGDHAAWREVRHFDVLARQLPPQDPVARRPVAWRP
jgi:hypothetical protein